MANWYVSSVGYTAVAQFAISHLYSSSSNGGRGDYIRQLAAPSVGNERVFRCTTGGTSAGSEPSWNLGHNATTTSGTAVFTECTGDEAEQAANAWNAPAARVQNILTRTGYAAGDFLFLSSDHAETQSTAYPNSNSTDYGGTKFISVNRGSGSHIPPQSGDILAGASISTTGASNINLGGTSGSSTNSAIYYYGITFNAGSAGNTASIFITNLGNGTNVICDGCSLVLNNTSTSSFIQIGSTANIAIGNHLILNNTSLGFNHASQGILFNSGSLDWSNSSSGLTGGAVPTTLFLAPTAGFLRIKLAGIDLSALNTAIFANSNAFCLGDISIRNCRLSSSVQIINGNPISPFVNGATSTVIKVDNCDDSSNNRNYRFAWYAFAGNALSDSGVVRTGGASDGTTGIAWKANTNTGTTANGPSVAYPLTLPPMAIRYNTTGSSKNATIYFVSNTASLLTNAQLWFDIEALTNSSYPCSTITSARVADLLSNTSASNLTTDTSAWNGSVSARQNSHAYNAGDAISIASAASGTIWFCTTAGTTAGSEPGGYTSAGDGTTVNDGTAVFRSGRRCKITVAFTPQEAGVVFAIIKIAAASSTIYIDPLIDIS